MNWYTGLKHSQSMHTSGSGLDSMSEEAVSNLNYGLYFL